MLDVKSEHMDTVSGAGFPTKERLHSDYEDHLDMNMKQVVNIDQSPNPAVHDESHKF